VSGGEFAGIITNRRKSSIIIVEAYNGDSIFLVDGR
jgi:hypothetical protein